MSLKRRIQESLHRRQVVLYEEELTRQKEGYCRHLSADAIRIPSDKVFSRTIRKCCILNEEALSERGPKDNAAAGKNEAATGSHDDGLIIDADKNTEIFILIRGEGYLDGDAAEKIAAYFEEHPDCEWLYADEDVCTTEKTLILPYLKPDWSPETLRSYNYIGNIFAFRNAKILNLVKADADSAGRDFLEVFRETNSLSSGGDIASDLIYSIASIFAERSPAYHLREVLYHYCDKDHTVQDRMYIGTGKVQYRYPVYDVPAGARIGILIPSKDHPDILERCVRSIREKSSFKDYEIIVVDNGSTAEHRSVYEACSETYAYRYFYEPMEFHFSRMCNLAAEKSGADYLLFLNDDTEVITTDWLERMLGQAAQEGIGAVGAKLYYPDGDLIQHAGITNMYEGPVHKLFGWSDAADYDRGRNRGVRNVIGVTAACLMVSRKCFEEIGGFPEELAVAYNDVDFCFSLDEKGYRNVIRNDVLLTHYESLSRGDDNIDDAKKERLKNERATLYARHPKYYNADPYYHPALTGASERYEIAVPLENKNLPVVKELEYCRARLNEGEINETLIMKRDHLEACFYADDGRQKAYLIDIHAHVRGLDSCDYNYHMYLKGEDGSVIDVPAVRRYRPDVEKTYYEQTHVELSGFAIKIAADALPHGSYEIWMEAKSALSRQRLINRLGMKLMIE